MMTRGRGDLSGKTRGVRRMCYYNATQDGMNAEKMFNLIV